MKLTDMSRVTKIPVSTLFDKIKTYEGSLIKKHTSLVRFDMLGYQAKALVVFSAAPKDRQRLLELLDKSRNVNSLYKINNGWDYMAEVLFPGVKEVEDFIESIEEEIRLKGRKVFYVIDEIKRECFLSNPGVAGLVL
jgi:DNA-binding Lrp family transcriptional regulator